MFVDDSGSVSSYYKLSRNGQLFVANAQITAPVAYSTAAGIGGPLLWNGTGPSQGGSKGVIAVILGLSIGWTTGPTATGAMGISWGSGQNAAPTTTTAITGVSNPNTNFPNAPLCSVFSVGTVANAGKSILVTHSVSTAGTPSDNTFVPLDGLVEVLPGGWAAVCAAAAIAALVAQCSLVWAEVPL